MIAESLLGSALGGLLRLAPEWLKWLDRKNERQHELAMLDKEMEFAKVRGGIAMREAEVKMTAAELDAMTEALKEQGATARAAGKWVAAASALVRPVVTYWFVFLYTAAKVAGMVLAVQQSGSWKEVLVSSWSEQDMAILSMILTFWFVGRVWERSQKP